MNIETSKQLKKIKLNLGCGSRFKDGYINIDFDSIDEITKRYPNIDINDNCKFVQCNILELPYENGTVDEIRADAILEHLSFKEESLFFAEVKRVLKKGGILNFSVPDFEVLITKWIVAKDDWKDFFRDDDEAIKQEHWFGQYSYSQDSRWGYLMAGIFGPQNGKGQTHRNAYSKLKIESIFKKINFEEIEISDFLWKGNRDLMIRAIGKKI